MPKKILLIIIAIYIFTATVSLLATVVTGAPKDDNQVIKNEDNIIGVNLVANDVKVKFYDTVKGVITEMVLEEYICGVVAAEMPANYNIEAIKAQAVAARSYVLYRMGQNTDKKSPPHYGADVCTDSKHCKGYISKEDARKKWGDSWFNSYWQSISSSVAETKGIIIAYNNKPANAVFCAASSGTTENAVDVWGCNVPYLKSVDSPYDKNSPWQISQERFSSSEFQKIIASAFPDAKFDSLNELWIKKIVHLPSGMVSEVDLCGIKASGKDLREIFVLKSTNFELVYVDGFFVFTTHGYGHGVGLSQYAANEMAQNGRNYKDILKWFYTGVDIVNMGDILKTTNNS